ncbi:glycogen synthase GlgA [Ligilactobacillus ceti]|uniref:Glycogen synthase n=1 Tax=Ligilactobacillus ceti DSM 22408 TaxID=1122146 RepID=A0A0R2KQX8_9LACO|nr:glycogen synthase GlgA [Ligilactobacillus ceti]KRN89989.1 glycogen synthase [Ligilactobacillus ceti DSM 22408]
MKILYAASECAPFIKTGGLGDVVGALPKSLAQKGHQVAVVLPYYHKIADQYQQQIEYLMDFTVEVGWRHQYCGVKYLKLDQVNYYFIDNEYYFARDGVYGYYDDGERFAFFQQAVIEMMEKVDFIPDVLNVNDYHTGFIPFLLKEKYSWIEAYQKIATVLTIHNLEFQGQYGEDTLMELFGMELTKAQDGTVMQDGCVNWLKTGILYADKVNTVSPTYASEIQTPAFGCRLDSILRQENYKLSGILNGIDYSIQNPQTDSLITHHYSVQNLKGKAQDKAILQKEYQLPVRDDVPVIGVVSRLTDQKGFQLVLEEMENLLQFDIQFVLLGTGYQKYEEAFKYFAQRYPDKCGVKITFDIKQAQEIYAGSDLFLMPSAFEPCGLSQMISMRYGTLPIVHQIGGLQDSVNVYNPIEQTGNGFGFSEFSSFYMMETIKQALAVYSQADVWLKMMETAMQTDFSWKTASEKYLALYQSII